MNYSDIKALVRPNILALSPYSTARDELQGKPEVFLDANESPYPSGWNRYPDPRQKVLKARISQIKGIAAEKIFLGNGSDEAIDLVFRIFCEPGKDNAVAIDPSYGMYEVAAQINDIQCRKAPLEKDFSLDVEKLLSLCDSNTKLIFLCSPNNPSGNSIPAESIEKIFQRFRGIVVLDEAYIDFSSQPGFAGRLEEFPRLIILQTMSKARAMAALRIGMAFASEYIISLMSMVKYPYNINEASQKTALKVLESPIDAQVEEIKRERGRVARELEAFSCVERVYPSDANFLLAKVDNADALYDHLIADGVIVRNRSKMANCSNCLRITIGLIEENDKLLKSIQAYEKGDIHR